MGERKDESTLSFEELKKRLPADGLLWYFLEEFSWKWSKENRSSIYSSNFETIAGLSENPFPNL